MAVPCPRCNRPVEAADTRCPHCGKQIARSLQGPDIMSYLLAGVVGALLLAGVLFVVLWAVVSRENGAAAALRAALPSGAVPRAPQSTAIYAAMAVLMATVTCCLLLLVVLEKWFKKR